jgi:predicted Zn-dependent protease
VGTFAPADSLEHVQSVYDRHRYLDLYALTSECWNASTDIGAAPVDALVLGARLAWRLGGQRLSRWLLREALRREPSNPKVRYFAHNVDRPRGSLLDELRSFIADPDIGGEDAGLRASWYASFAYCWATLRDFDRAYECLGIGHSLSANDSWVFSMESSVHGLADRWADALRSAERAQEIDPGAPFAAQCLGTALINLGRVEESAARLFTEAGSCQSYEIVLAACWHQCALAETLDGEQRRAALDHARLAGRLPVLMPLADRETLKIVARMNLDIAGLSDDYAGIERWTSEVHSPFHRQLLANLARNAAGKRVRLPFRRTIQKYDACLPASLAAALSAGGMIVSEDEMAAQITFGGTPDWAAADWLRARGYHVRFFFATPEVAAALIRERIAFVVCWEDEESGHAVAVVGMDERAETLLVHDPRSFRSAEYLFSALDPGLSPVGILAMAVVRQERAMELDALLPPGSAVMEAAQEHSKQMALHGPSAAQPVVAGLLERFPTHPGTCYLEAAQELEAGQVGQAMVKLQELLRRFPRSPRVRVHFLHACHSLGNTALVRQALKDIVEAGTLPGLDSQQDWIHPPDRYIYEYADLLRLSTETRQRAESLLHKLIKRQGSSAGAWHNLADLLWDKGDRPGALIGYRISAGLAENNEHYARAYADALAAERREEEAFQWLGARARRFRDSPHAVGTWISWISALEDRGYPERALSACDEALAQRGASAELLAFAVPFFARMGDWTRAEAERDRLRDAGAPHAYFEASTRLSRMRGDLESAAANATAWITELPRSIDARRAMLDILDARDGHEAAVAASRQWLSENRDHEFFEEAYCAELHRASAPRGKKYAVLLRRLKRNPEDAWAWRELTFTCLFEYMRADDRERKRLEPRIARYLTECDRTSGGTVPTLRIHALWSELRGDWAASVARSLEAIALDPESFFSYGRAWECSSRFGADEREELRGRIEAMLVDAPGRLSIARGVAGLIAERFGVAASERSVEKLRAARPEDPDVLEAAAGLLIDHGHGRSDAARAIAMLEPAVPRFPYHPGLRLSLANALRRAGRDSDAEAVLAEIARRHPDMSSAKIQLAWIRSRQGDVKGACGFLDQAMAAEPRNSELLDTRAQILIGQARFEEAMRDIEDGLRRLPSDAAWRDRAVALLAQCGAADRAIQAARAGVEADPGNAALWLGLGRALYEMRQFADVGEIEGCFRKGLELDGALLEAADLLAVLLTEQRRFDDASKIMLDFEPRLPDPSPARGRLAWIRRQRGQTSEAVADMAGLLEAFPWYGWGWSMLMSWLEEDGAWERARQLLGSIPPPLSADSSFRLRRLQLLQEANADVEKLDEEWDGLLRDYPEDVVLHVSRYDALDRAMRTKEAAAVIEAIVQVEPNDPFVLARRCDMFARDKDNEAACEIALRVCFLPGAEYTWPSEKAWEVARRDGFAAELSLRWEQRLQAGDKPTVQSLLCLASYAMRKARKRSIQRGPSARFPGRGARDLMRLVDRVSGASWDGSEHRAAVYSVLCDYGYNRLVTELSAKIGPGAVTSVNEWAQIGRAFVAGRQSAYGRDLLGSWRGRTGVAMWMVTNYILSLSRSRPDQLQERYGSARDALAGLPHDHCAKYLAHIQAEACALLGRKDDFLETWAAHGRYFDGQLGSGEFFRNQDRYLLAGVPRLADELTRYQGWHARGAFRKFRMRRRFGRPAKAPSEEARTEKNTIPTIWIFLIAAALIRVIFGSFNSSWAPARVERGPDQPSPSNVGASSFALSARDLVARVTQSSSGEGSYWATAEVSNRGTKTYHFVIVKVEFCDERGRVVGTLMTEGRSAELIPPGGIRLFRVSGRAGLRFSTVRASVAYSAEWK